MLSITFAQPSIPVIWLFNKITAIRAGPTSLELSSALSVAPSSFVSFSAFAVVGVKPIRLLVISLVPPKRWNKKSKRPAKNKKSKRPARNKKSKKPESNKCV